MILPYKIVNSIHNTAHSKKSVMPKWVNGNPSSINSVGKVPGNSHVSYSMVGEKNIAVFISICNFVHGNISADI